MRCSIDVTLPPSHKPPKYDSLRFQDIINLLFRQYKLWEITQDIEATRQRGSHHALPQFHRLHIQVHDEWVQLKKEIEEFDGMTNPDEVLHQIAIAVQGLPPILRDRLESMLAGDNVIVFPKSGQ